MNNEWKEIKGYEGYYLINRDGIVKSVERYVKQGHHLRHVPERIKKMSVGPYGYPCVTLCKNRKSKVIPIHILLAKAFIPNPDNKPFIDHINTDKTDYRLENLRWVTAKENANNPLTLQHCRERTYTKERAQKALRTKALRGGHGAPIRVYQYSKDGEFLGMYDCMEEAHLATGAQATVIKKALNDPTSSAGGYLWTTEKVDKICYCRRPSSQRKAVLQYDKDGNFIREWESVRAAAKGLGLHDANITRNIKSKTKQYRKYMFKFKTED